MTDFPIVTEHALEALSLLIDQYSGLPRLSGLVSSAVNRVQELENITWDVANKRLIDYTALDGTSASATGEQLEAIGRLVGIGRGNLPDDATYLIYIRAQTFLNKSKARRDDVIGLLRLIESVAFTYADYAPATVVVSFVGAPVTSPLTLVALAKRAVSGGVRLILEALPPTFTAATAFTARDSSATNNAALGFGHYGSAAYGGHLSSIYD